MNNSLETSDIKLKFGRYCSKHNFKYPYFFCYDCKSSICSQCLQQGDHKLHNYIEKYDYLQNSRGLVEQIFQDLNLHPGEFDDKAVFEIKNRIKTVSFPLLKDLLSQIEGKVCDTLDHFWESEQVSYSNLQQNVGLLKSHCTEGLDKLKDQIAINELIADEEVFLTFDRKFKEIASEKIKIQKDNLKYEEFRRLMTVITVFVEKIYSEIYTFLQKYTISVPYTEIKTKITENIITLVSKDDIFNRLLSDVKKKGFQRSASKFDLDSQNYMRALNYKDEVSMKEGNAVTPLGMSFNINPVNTGKISKPYLNI